MRIAYFGGAFDPPHAGHLAGARAMLKSGAADRIWLAPSYAPPHKNGGGMAGFADRIAMLKLLTAGEPEMTVSEAERELGIEPSYTFDVLTELSVRYPQDRFLLLIGGDSLLYLQDWHRGRELAEKFEVWTWPRPGSPVTMEFLAGHWPPELAEKLAARCLDCALTDVSSSGLRKCLAQGGDTAAMLPENVAEYIRKNHLYRGGRKKMNDTVKTRVAPEELAQFCAKAADDKLAENVVTIPMAGKSSVTDFLVIATATSMPHLTGLAAHLEREVREKYQLHVYSNGGESQSGWVVLDFVTVVVHLLLPDMRTRYGLESLWSGAPSREAMEEVESHIRRR